MTGHNNNFNSQDLDYTSFSSRVARFNRTVDKIKQEIAKEQLAPITTEEADKAVELLCEKPSTIERDANRRIVIDQKRAADLGLVALTSSPESVAKTKISASLVEQPLKKDDPEQT
jgi:hypothetical protein